MGKRKVVQIGRTTRRGMAQRMVIMELPAKETQ